MRTKGCFLIGRARCVEVEPIRIAFRQGRRHEWIKVGDSKLYLPESLYKFACADGFMDWGDLHDFWDREHGISDFEGVLIGNYTLENLKADNA